MIDPATLNLILSAVSGPASGVAVALLCMAGFGYFLINWLLPQQERMLNAALEDSKKNRKVFVDAVEVMSRRLERVEEDISEIKQVIVTERM
jgi:RNase adaptor protein for sRNA GlmZ degradation